MSVNTANENPEIGYADEALEGRIRNLEWDVYEDVPGDSLFGRLRVLERNAESRDRDIKTLSIAFYVLLALYIGLVLAWILVP